MITKRATPLAAEPPADTPHPGSTDRPPPASTPDAFTEQVRTLRIGTARVQLSERILLVLGGTLAPLGIVVVLLGWWGAARTPRLFEQVPYLISGGLLGLALVFLGSFFYFTHWLTELVKEHRRQSVTLLAAIEGLRTQVAQLDSTGPATINNNNSSNGHQPEPIALVATERGSMAHRTDCVVVARKPGLHAVHPNDGLRACKLCEPY